MFAWIEDLRINDLHFSRNTSGCIGNARDATKQNAAGTRTNDLDLPMSEYWE
jgi:hypothetical protein